MTGNETSLSEVINNGLLGLWALLGAVSRGTADWTNPVTRKFSWPRFGVGIATALVLGQITHGVLAYFNISPELGGAAAGMAGYLGPAATIGLVFKVFDRKGSDDDGKGK